MLKLQTTTQYHKDRRRAIKRGFDMQRLDNVIQMLQQEKRLDFQYHDHALIGSYSGFSECHIQSDWLLVYAVDNESLILSRTGTHSDIFQS